MNPSNKPPTLLRSLLALSAALTMALPLARAQQAPASTPDAATLTKYDKNKNGRLDPDEIATMQADQRRTVPVETKPEDKTVELSPFEVVSDTKGYYSANAMSATRFNSKLDDMASSITVVTKAQMTDFAMLDINDIFNYTANTEGTGTYTDFSINRNGDAQDNVMANPTQANRIRGIAPANYALNNIQTMGRVPVDPIGIDSIEISRGPNANIFGLGNPSGTINMVPSAANLTRDLSEVTARGDSYDGYRFTLDANRVLWKNKVAIRGQAVFQHDGFQREPSGVNTIRYNGMVKFQPFAKTTLSAVVSYYDSNGNRPNFVEPRDYVSYWAKNGKPTWDPIAQVVHVNGTTLGPFTAATYAGPDYFQQTFTGSNHAFAYVDSTGLNYWAAPTGFTNATPLAGATTAGPTSGAVKFLLSTTPQSGATLGRSTTQPLFTTTASIGDKALYDYSSVNLGAVNRTHTRTLTSSVQLDQLFFNTPRQTLALQAGVMREDSQQVVRSLIGTQNANGQSGQLFIDINEKNIDGSPNPYLGHAYIGTDQPITLSQPAKWDTYRAQLGYKLDLSHEPNALKWLGLHQFNLYDEYKYRINRQYGYKDAMASSSTWIPAGMSRANQGAITGGPAAALAITRNYYRYYVGGSDNVVDYAPSDFGYGTYPFVWGNPNTGVFNHENTALSQVAVTDSTGAGNNTKVILKTLGIVTQNHFLDDRLVTTFGLREDQQYTKTGSVPQLLNPDGTTFNYPTINSWAAGDYRFNSGKTKQGGAVARPFRDITFLKQMDESTGASHFFGNLLRGMSFSYNKSDSFIPINPATDVFLKPLPVPTGRDKSYGVGFSLFDNLSLTIKHYETVSINNRGGDAGTIAQRVTRIDLTSNAAFLLVTQAAGTGATPGWIRVAHPEFTEQQVQDELAREIGVPTATQNAIVSAFNAGTISATQDITAKGNEVELYYNPTRYWTLVANFAEKESINTNVATSINDWIAQRMPIWTTIVDQRDGSLWWTHNYGGSQTAQQNYISFVQTPYAVTQQKQGKANPQVGKYSGSVSTSYQLAGITDHHILKNFTVGGAFRWQSPVAIDYYGATPAAGSTVFTALDVNKPIYQTAQYHVDLLASYQMRLFHDRVPTRLQFNVTDLQYGHTKLIPINAFPDGTPSGYRIVDPRKFILTATFDL